MATSRSVLGCTVTSWCTEREAKELERMGYTVGMNGAYLLGKDKAPAHYLWPPSAFPEPSSHGFRADPGGAARGRGMVEFDDLMAAARYLLIEVSNGA